MVCKTCHEDTGLILSKCTTCIDTWIVSNYTHQTYKKKIKIVAYMGYYFASPGFKKIYKYAVVGF